MPVLPPAFLLGVLSVAAFAAEPSAPLDELAAAVNARGAELTAEDLAPLFDAGALHDGFGAKEAAAGCATALRGATVTAVELSGVPVPGGDEAALAGRLLVTTSSGPAVLRLDDGGRTLCPLDRVRRGGDGRWRLSGNGRAARAEATAVLTRRQWDAPCPACGGRTLRLALYAPPSAVSAATATWPGGQAELRRSEARSLERVLVPGPGRALEVWSEAWVWEAEQGAPPWEGAPPSGAEVSFAFTTAAGARTVGPLRVPSWPGSAARISAPAGHRLADARLGSELRVRWEVPPGFVPASAELTGLTRAEGAVCAADVKAPRPGPDARTAVLTWPSTCSGNQVRPAKRRVGDPPAELTLRLTDGAGRALEVRHAFW
ncbi:hypothetical protein EPO15_05685 [bacterium]|nr:MAG: hypothetical protein EPO15_05685 [bacterium]